jgi:hypothetical protein
MHGLSRLCINGEQYKMFLLTLGMKGSFHLSIMIPSINEGWHPSVGQVTTIDIKGHPTTEIEEKRLWKKLIPEMESILVKAV